MENRANYALVGAFFTLALAALVGFVYWFSTGEDAAARTRYDVVFEGAVTGLAAGTDVLFNGLRVGTVSRVGIDPEDPNQVVARIEVDSGAPVMEDTQALMEIQGLTGLAHIQLLGGSLEAGPLTPPPGEEIATLQGQPSDFQAIMEGARDIIASADSTFRRLDDFLSANETSVSTTLSNIENISSSLAGFASAAGEDEGVQNIVSGLGTTIESANSTLSRLDGLIAANEDAVTSTVTNFQSISSSLAGFTQAAGGEEGLRTLATDLGETIGTANTTLSRIDGVIAENRDNFSTALANAATVSDSIAQFTTAMGGEEGLGSLADRINTAVADATTTISRVDSLVAENAEGMSATVANLQSVSGSVAGFIEAAGGEEGLASLADDLGATVRSANTTFSQIDGLIAENRESVGATVANLQSASASVAGFLEAAGGEEGLTTLADDLSQTVANANTTFSQIDGLIAENREGVGATVANLQSVSGSLAGFVEAAGGEEGLARLATELGDTVQTANTTFSQIDGLIAENREGVSATIASLRSASASLAGFMEAAGGEEGLAEIAGNIGTAVESATSTFGRIDGLIARNSAALDTTVANAATISTTLTGFLEAAGGQEGLNRLATDLGQTVASANSTLTSVDTLIAENRSSITATIDNAEAVSTTFAQNAEGIESFLASLSQASEQIVPLADELRVLSSDLRQIVEVVPPDQVARTFTDVSDFANALARNTENIDEFFTDAGELAANLSGVSQGLQTTLDLIDEASEAIDPAVIERAMANIDTFSIALGENAESVDQIIGNTSQLTQTLNDAATRVDTIIARVDDLVATDAGESMFGEIGEAATAVRDLARQLNVRTESITENLDSFTAQGLNEYVGLANQARGTLQRLDRLLTTLERNPQVFVFGGDSVRDFQR